MCNIRRRMTLLRNIGILVALVAIGVGSYVSWIKLFPNCHSAFYSPTKYTATKSPYLVDYDAVPTSISKDCSPHQIWMLIRHGTRTPGADVIKELKTLLPKLRDEIVVNYEEGRSSLCETEFNGLKSWLPIPNVKETDEKILMPQGAKEMAGIASRFQKRFPNLFPKQFKNETFRFKFTKTERTRDSADAFSGALFGEAGKSEVWYPESLHADPILRFYKGCERWKKNVNKNPDTYSEQRLFAESLPFQETVKSVTQRLGFQTNISTHDVLRMYQACCFETAWNPEMPSPWCSAFGEQDLQVLEYYQDLDYYWVDGYGHELTYKLACPAVNDFIQHFESRIQNESESPNVIAYFTHSGTTLKFLARLGLFKDTESLRSDNFHSNSKRKWRTSVIDSFASNIGIVLYKCPNEYRVGMLFQETEIPLTYCNNKLHCSFDEFRSRITEAMGECDNEKICRLQK